MNNKIVVLKKVKQLLEIKYSGGTPENYIYHIGLFLEHSNNVPDRVTNEDILNYNISIRNKSNSFRNVSINAIKAYFKLYLRRKVKDFSSIRPPKEYKKPKVYDALIIDKKLDDIKNLKHRLILRLGISCWLRQSEVVNLKIEDIDSELMILRIRDSKGSKSRDVKFNEKTLDLLRAYWIEFKPKTYLFNGQKSLKYNSVNAVCQNHLGFRFHALRASGATYALNNGTDIKTVSEMLGHNKIETTKHYIPVLLERVAQV